MSADRRARAAEIVPVSERARYLNGFRAALVALLAVILLTDPGALLTPAAGLAYVTSGYALVVVLAQALFTALPRAQVRVFGATLLIDGAFLAWAAYATGSASSPLRFVIVLHVIAVALLASYRTGLKVALWHSLLLIVVFNLQRDGELHAITSAGIGIGAPFSRLLEFSALFWVVAIATAAFSAVNERELRRRRYDTEALATMATELESVTEPGQVAATLLLAVVETFNFTRAAVIASQDGDPATVLASHGQVGSPTPAEFDRSASALATACASHPSVLVSELHPEDDAWLHQLMPRAQNIIAVPLVAEGIQLGILVAEHGRRFGGRMAHQGVSMVERFVSHGTLALRNAWLLEQIHHMATTDGLTGIANRVSFDQTLVAELSRAARQREDVSLLLLDIDHFKTLNDAHGHQVGDAVLRVVGTTLTAACREFDTAARYGGEEFAVLLPETSKGEAIEVAERLRVTIQGLRSGLGVTVSAGVATFPFDGTSPHALIAAADGALYAAKRDGRNRVTTADAPDEARNAIP